MNPEEIRESGLLELYIFGVLEGRELALVNEALAEFPALQKDLLEIENSLLKYIETVSPAPHGAVQPLLLATLDYKERLRKGEQPVTAPLLNENSRIEDYAQWLTDPGMVAPEGFDAMFAKIIAFEPDKTTAIVWLRYGAPDETHTNEYEKFLIVEGSCEITIGREVYIMKAGDYLTIPLFINHNVRVISEIPCKIILQRVAV
jgi:mannose-6-phosphate isomerase-like protein (cupin superfamily)